MPVILLTRPEEAAHRFAKALRVALGEVEVITSPLMAIRFEGVLPDGEAMPIFTSRYGVAAFAHAGGKPTGECWCVGEATAQAAEQLGFAARFAGGDATSLVEAILESGDKGPFLHVRGQHLAGDVAKHLSEAGLPARSVVLYDQVAQPLSQEALVALDGKKGGGKPVVVPLFSPRSAGLFSEEMRETGRNAPIFVAAMSEAVANAAAPLQPEKMQIAARLDAGAMVEAVAGLYDAALALEGAAGAT
ncbi:uroporphyrinogen-III synthase [Rhodalgimonas zhirmunskyi]|uniref:Uroporphyrinogen-III synthase n=1 Tax=Rhodalgimonas zhirmunskyi TaxID=2964767 RepID=A0AAJ1U9M6_9RHOB|nr:uroporphyrinogen-III synthase [Rhodoalgimonas zhirmunskyi]MDQ2094350.1 uroporphyrinogen-III synthase [Rhodoalgimonas zhirmunskyi]